MNKKIEVAVFTFKDLVLFPHAAIPMYIFESNYLQMIEDCIQNNIPLAMGQGNPVLDQMGNEIPNALRPRKIMGIGKPTIIERFDDGSVYLLVEGNGKKVSLGKATQNLPYLKCEAEIVEECKSSPQHLFNNPIERLYSILKNWIQSHIQDRKQRQSFLKKIKGPREILDYAAMFLIKDRNVKQSLLEAGSFSEKAFMLDVLLRDKGSVDQKNKNMILMYEDLEDHYILAQ